LSRSQLFENRSRPTHCGAQLLACNMSRPFRTDGGTKRGYVVAEDIADIRNSTDYVDERRPEEPSCEVPPACRDRPLSAMALRWPVPMRSPSAACPDKE
jgi:hypothetical protein